MAKSSKTEVLHRVNELVKIILSGAEFVDIRDYSNEMGWGVTVTTNPDGTETKSGGLSDSQLRVYQNRAYGLIVQQAEKDRERLFRRHQQQRRNLYARAIEAGDVRAALSVAKDEAELLGLYPEKLSPIEVLLASLPSQLANAVRASLAAPVGQSAPTGLPAGNAGEGSEAGSPGPPVDGSPESGPQLDIPPSVDGTGCLATEGSALEI